MKASQEWSTADRTAEQPEMLAWWSRRRRVQRTSRATALRAHRCASDLPSPRSRCSVMRGLRCSGRERVIDPAFNDWWQGEFDATWGDRRITVASLLRYHNDRASTPVVVQGAWRCLTGRRCHARRLASGCAQSPVRRWPPPRLRHDAADRLRPCPAPPPGVPRARDQRVREGSILDVPAARRRWGAGEGDNQRLGELSEFKSRADAQPTPSGRSGVEVRAHRRKCRVTTIDLRLHRHRGPDHRCPRGRAGQAAGEHVSPRQHRAGERDGDLAAAR